ncbi:aminotransferase-like domain-containing protein [Salibacterium qingdaonense]|uniref:2-aminoadipate transaminase n=1 Tax=Salibacterium qingdaonense TaxID=266892 RepID=A0A1I4PK23_9BACI|nr:PLP-dependent aminotransferase family protein [Salibacterium qingdaonense]SFM27865.1 2-aminoadipate transaminase [Salibacterium qingdaonense]
MKYGFAKRVNHMQSSAVRDILKVVNRGDVISFAGGLPDENLFPVEEVREAFNKALDTDAKALQYGETEGVPALRSKLTERMADKGIHRMPENVLITSGSQQAIDLFARVMFNPGDIVLTENPTYLAAIQVFQSYEVNIVPVDADNDGMTKEDLETKIQQLKPKCIYIVPTYSNPDGKVWSLERRKELLRLAEKYHTIVFEDDPYGDIKFDEAETVAPLASLDENKYVVYTSTFSKTVVPAMRTGWITGPYQIIRMMAQAKQATDLHTNSLTQHALVKLLEDFDLDAHIRTLQRTYKERMHVMKDIFDRADDIDIRYHEPKGGMFFWVSMPEYVNTKALLDDAVDNGVAFVPGAPFYVNQPAQNTMRLNFTNAEPELIEEGMKRLVEVMNSAPVQK